MSKSFGRSRGCSICGMPSFWAVEEYDEEKMTFCEDCLGWLIRVSLTFFKNDEKVVKVVKTFIEDLEAKE